jgi:hypothetical protein
MESRRSHGHQDRACVYSAATCRVPGECDGGQMSKFGPFSSAFGSYPGYLAFLRMSTDCQVVIDRVEDSIGNARGIEEGRAGLAVWMARLFEEVNWRPHLVGAIALLLGAGRAAEIGALWRAIDRGSWVGPQLVVTAYFRDPEFASAARTRIAGRCPLLEGEYPFGWGEPQPRHFSAKTLSSLLAVTSRIPPLTGWIEAARQ